MDELFMQCHALLTGWGMSPVKAAYVTLGIFVGVPGLAIAAFIERQRITWALKGKRQFAAWEAKQAARVVQLRQCGVSEIIATATVFRDGLQLLNERRKTHKGGRWAWAMEQWLDRRVDLLIQLADNGASHGEEVRQVADLIGAYGRQELRWLEIIGK